MKSPARAPIITLLAVATVLPELFTGSTSITAFFNPGLLIFLFIGYGVAVLLVRELAARCHSGLLGLFFFGLSYSILNEGLMAKTMILKTALPVAQYNDYAYHFGLSVAWMAGIAAWHAVASVMMPILITYHFFPAARTVPWLKGRTAVLLSLVIMFLSCAAFLGTSEKGVQGHVLQLGLLLLVMLVCFLIGTEFGHEIEIGPVRSRSTPVLLGFSVIIPFWGLAILAATKQPLFLYCLALIAVVFAYAAILKRWQCLSLPSFLLFGIGWYLHNIIQSVAFITLGFHNPLLGLSTLLVDGTVLMLLYKAIVSPTMKPTEPAPA